MLNAVIDLSHHNGPVDFGRLSAAGILGVIHKCTQGVSFVDSQYTPRKNLATQAGILWGAYHFGDGTDGKQQAAWFLGHVGDAPLLVLDFEENPTGPSMELGQAYDFISAVSLSSGRLPVLYGGFYLRQLLAGKPDSLLSTCPLWLADYRSHPEILPGWDSWTLWQYTDGKKGNQPHEVDGAGAVDRDMFLGSDDELEAFWKGGQGQ